MKRPINSQNLDLNLNQLAAFQNFPRRLSGTGQTEAIRNNEGPSVRRSKELSKLNRN
jgi:hypothetical protein